MHPPRFTCSLELWIPNGEAPSFLSFEEGLSASSLEEGDTLIHADPAVMVPSELGFRVWAFAAVVLHPDLNEHFG